MNDCLCKYDCLQENIEYIFLTNIKYLCEFLDPQEWSRDQVRAWLQFTMKQFKIALSQDIESIFDEDGKQLSRLNEIDFINRIPQVSNCMQLVDLSSFI